MRKLGVFESISLDGYCKSSGDQQWMHNPRPDPEFAEFVASNASSGGELLFGRTTYEHMAAFWPSAAAAQQMPVVARRMNAAVKHVLSRSLTAPAWTNTCVHADIDAIRALVATDGPPITILGSGSVVAQLAEARLIDEYALMVVPVALGTGTPLFASRVDLQLQRSRAFANGNVLLVYR